MLIIIVLYKEQLQSTNTYRSLCTALDNISEQWQTLLYLYDNSPSAQIIDKRINGIYTHNGDNAGLSVAYNEAAKYATHNGFEWMLLLDQDTTLSADFFVKTIAAIENNPQCKLFAPTIKSQNDLLISPFRVRYKVGKILRSELYGEIDSKKYAVINSGMTINVEAFNRVGGYCNAVKLDFSDTIFIERYCTLHPTLYITDAKCVQQLSAFELDVEKLKFRFALFCQGAKSCPKSSITVRISYFIVVIKRMLSLIIQTKSTTFVSLFWENYVRR